jgi:leucine dehydrogenase
MTYKAAVAGLNLGGGKSVIWGDNRTARPRDDLPGARPPRSSPSEGRYITAEDVGTSPEDMEYIGMETEHVVGLRAVGRSVSGDGVRRLTAASRLAPCALR